MSDIKLFAVLDNEKQKLSENEIKLTKEKEYLDYIKLHKENVIKAFDEMTSDMYLNSTFNSDIVNALNELKFIIEEHDNSKFSDEEFDAYRKEFYPINEEEKEENQDDFELAWKHHYMVNDHHPEHWAINGVAQDMSLRAILEMICDWQSFYYIGKGGAQEYWNKIKGSTDNEAKFITPNTAEQIDRILKLFNYND